MPWILKFRMKDDFMFGQQDFIQTFEQKWIEMLSLLETNKVVRVARDHKPFNQWFGAEQNFNQK